MSKNIITVTKMESARRQLLTAVELWFREADPISIHALAYASHEIIHRMFRLKGLTDLLYDASVVKESARPMWNKLLKKAGNFIKHAKIEKDPDAKLEFAPFANDMFIIMSLDGLRRMEEDLQPQELAFLTWQSLHTTYLSPGLLKEDIPIHILEQMRAVKRTEFLEYFLSKYSVE